MTENMSKEEDTMQRLIVIGGDAAGMSAASQIRRMHSLCVK